MFWTKKQEAAFEALMQEDLPKPRCPYVVTYTIDQAGGEKYRIEKVLPPDDTMGFYFNNHLGGISRKDAECIVKRLQSAFAEADRMQAALCASKERRWTR